MSDDFYDDERDGRGSVDPTSYDREGAALKSRSCPDCGGVGLKTVFDFDYTGSPIIPGIDDLGNSRPRVGRTCAYCVCLLGRWILHAHRKTAKDVYQRTPDFADIKARPSFWLERDPTQRELTSEQISIFPEFLRRALAERLRVTP